MMNIYFICTGNTCRSPMAEAILTQKQLPHVHVRSAGIFALDGGEMSEHAKQTLDHHCISHTHISRTVTLENLQWADIVLTMTVAHRDIIVQNYPQIAHKTFTLKEYVAPYSALDVSDPYGGDMSVYVQTYTELNKYVDLLIEKIQQSEE